MTDCYSLVADYLTACAQVVDFYLDDKYAREREELVEICKEDNTSNEKIMAYAWEALSNVPIR